MACKHGVPAPNECFWEGLPPSCDKCLIEELERKLKASEARVRELEDAIEIFSQTLLEVDHAQRSGTEWYTRGESGLRQQVAMWVQRGTDAIKKLERVEKDDE